MLWQLYTMSKSVYKTGSGTIGRADLRWKLMTIGFEIDALRYQLCVFIYYPVF